MCRTWVSVNVGNNFVGVFRRGTLLTGGLKCSSMLPHRRNALIARKYTLMLDGCSSRHSSSGPHQLSPPVFNLVEFGHRDQRGSERVPRLSVASKSLWGTIFEESSFFQEGLAKLAQHRDSSISGSARDRVN